MHRATQIALQIGVKRVVSHVTEKCISLFTRRDRPLIEITRFRIFAFEKIGKLLNKFFVRFQKKIKIFQDFLAQKYLRDLLY